MSKALVTVNQSKARSGNDMIGGNKTVNVFENGGVIAQLAAKLAAEIEEQKEIAHTVASLACWSTKPVADGIIGLEAKLSYAGRGYEIEDALVAKEDFEKLLLRWSLFGSAQEIFAIYLGKIEHEFKYVILPQISSLDHVSFNEIFITRVADPIVFNNGPTVFSVTHRTVMGMFYWLAERCYVRWHS